MPSICMWLRIGGKLTNGPTHGVAMDDGSELGLNLRGMNWPDSWVTAGVVWTSFASCFHVGWHQGWCSSGGLLLQLLRGVGYTCVSVRC